MILRRWIGAIVAAALLTGQALPGSNRMVCGMERTPKALECSFCADDAPGGAQAWTADRSCCRVPDLSGRTSTALISSRNEGAQTSRAAAAWNSPAPFFPLDSQRTRPTFETPPDPSPPLLRTTVLLI